MSNNDLTPGRDNVPPHVHRRMIEAKTGVCQPHLAPEATSLWDGMPLQAEIAELRKDRERLDWLEASRRSCVLTGNGAEVWVGTGTQFNAPTIRSAIDAARQQEGL